MKCLIPLNTSYTIAKSLLSTLVTTYQSIQFFVEVKMVCVFLIQKIFDIEKRFGISDRIKVCKQKSTREAKQLS